MPEHVHMLLEIQPKLSVSSFMGYLKSKSSRMLYEQIGELKYKKRRVLVRRVLCRYGRKERRPNCGVYREPAGRTTYDE